jgi:hypothetical protein
MEAQIDTSRRASWVVRRRRKREVRRSFHLNRISERIARRFCLTAVLRGLRVSERIVKKTTTLRCCGTLLSGRTFPVACHGEGSIGQGVLNSHWYAKRTLREGLLVVNGVKPVFASPTDCIFRAANKDGCVKQQKRRLFHAGGNRAAVYGYR